MYYFVALFTFTATFTHPYVYCLLLLFSGWCRKWPFLHQIWSLSNTTKKGKHMHTYSKLSAKYTSQIWPIHYTSVEVQTDYSKVEQLIAVLSIFQKYLHIFVQEKFVRFTIFIQKFHQKKKKKREIAYLRGVDTFTWVEIQV